MTANQNSFTAVLIDGENIRSNSFGDISDRAAKIGKCTVWKVFGDFSEKTHADWLNVCRKHGLQAELELPAVSGKNSTDIAMVIAAMDLMISASFEALVLVSDDRDFLPLVRRLRLAGKNVHGFGCKVANPDLEGLYTSWTRLNGEYANRIAAHKIQVKEPPSDNRSTLAQPSPNKQISSSADHQAALKGQFQKLVRDRLSDGSLSLSTIGMWIRQSRPDLIPLLGPGKLKKLIQADNQCRLSGNSVTLIK